MRRALTALAISAALGIAACGGDSGGAADNSTTQATHPSTTGGTKPGNPGHGRASSNLENSAVRAPGVFVEAARICALGPPAKVAASLGVKSTNRKDIARAGEGLQAEVPKSGAAGLSHGAQVTRRRRAGLPRAAFPLHFSLKFAAVLSSDMARTPRTSGRSGPLRENKCKSWPTFVLTRSVASLFASRSVFSRSSRSPGSARPARLRRSFR
jgi:hypothetical protein